MHLKYDRPQEPPVQMFNLNIDQRNFLASSPWSQVYFIIQYFQILESETQCANVACHSSPHPKGINYSRQSNFLILIFYKV